MCVVAEMDPSLPEKILFLRSISSSIICPESARKYFQELKFEEYAPVYWKKIDPFIVAWEIEVQRLKKELACLTCESLSTSEIKSTIHEIKIEMEKISSQQEKSTPIDENSAEVPEPAIQISYPVESTFEIQMNESQEGMTVLGKRTQEEIIVNQNDLETKEIRIE